MTTDDVDNRDVGPTDRTESGSRDERPHSRACGWRRHDHGPECHSNCPTCGGHDPAPSVAPDSDQLRDELLAFFRTRYQLSMPVEITDALLSGPLQQLIARDAERGEALERVRALVEMAPVVRFDNGYPVRAVPVADFVNDPMIRRALDGEP